MPRPSGVALTVLIRSARTCFCPSGVLGQIMFLAAAAERLRFSLVSPGTSANVKLLPPPRQRRGNRQWNNSRGVFGEKWREPAGARGERAPHRSDRGAARD